MKNWRVWLIITALVLVASDWAYMTQPYSTDPTPLWAYILFGLFAEVVVWAFLVWATFGALVLGRVSRWLHGPPQPPQPPVQPEHREIIDVRYSVSPPEHNQKTNDPRSPDAQDPTQP